MITKCSKSQNTTCMQQALGKNKYSQKVRYEVLLPTGHQMQTKAKNS